MRWVNVVDTWLPFLCVFFLLRVFVVVIINGGSCVYASILLYFRTIDGGGAVWFLCAEFASVAPALHLCVYHWIHATTSRTNKHRIADFCSVEWKPGIIPRNICVHDLFRRTAHKNTRRRRMKMINKRIIMCSPESSGTTTFYDISDFYGNAKCWCVFVASQINNINTDNRQNIKHSNLQCTQ